MRALCIALAFTVALMGSVRAGTVEDDRYANDQVKLIEELVKAKVLVIEIRNKACSLEHLAKTHDAARVGVAKKACVVLYDLVLARREAQKIHLELTIVGLKLELKDREFLNGIIVPSEKYNEFAVETNRLVQKAMILYPPPEQKK